MDTKFSVCIRVSRGVLPPNLVLLWRNRLRGGVSAAECIRSKHSVVDAWVGGGANSEAAGGTLVTYGMCGRKRLGAGAVVGAK